MKYDCWIIIEENVECIIAIFIEITCKCKCKSIDLIKKKKKEFSNDISDKIIKLKNEQKLLVQLKIILELRYFWKQILKKYEINIIAILQRY